MHIKLLEIYYNRCFTQYFVDKVNSTQMTNKIDSKTKNSTEERKKKTNKQIIQ